MSCCPQNKESRSDSVAFNYRYDKLKDLTHYKCEPACLCRFEKPRSAFDQMQMNWIVGDKKPHVQPASNHFKKEWGT
jgi:hypothetical protein